jgi:hypothetical protein
MKSAISPLKFLPLWISFTLSVGSSAAQEGLANRVYVATDAFGQVFVKSIPDEPYGFKGTTKVYLAGKSQDTLIQTYPWYSQKVFVASFGGERDVYVVQTGEWHPGPEAAEGDLALAFFKNQAALRRYSTLDIAGGKGEVNVSGTRYSPFSRLIGFRHPFGGQFAFDIETARGALLSFDAETGDILTKEEEAVRKQLYDARIRIAQIKRKWYEQNQPNLPGIEEVLIEEKTLKDFAPQDYPPVPAGYRYVPDTVWKQVRFEKIEK